MNTNLYALITLIVILSLYSIRHRNSVCYYPNNLLTWQRVLCVYSNTAMALCEAIFHLWSHLYQIDILIQIQRSHGMFVCYSYMRCWRRDQIWSVMFGCFIIWHFLSFLLWVILRYFTLLTRQKKSKNWILLSQCKPSIYVKFFLEISKNRYLRPDTPVYIFRVFSCRFFI